MAATLLAFSACFALGQLSATQIAPVKTRQDADAARIDRLPQYFPSTFDSFERIWYHGQLAALEEPSLFEHRAGGETVYRFAWIPSFHHSVSARLKVNGDGTGFLTLKMASGAGGYHAGTLVRREEAAVTADQVKHFLALLSELQFWKVTDGSLNPTKAGEDGSQWVLEGISQGNYRIVEMWTPGSGTKLHEIGTYLVNDVGGWNDKDLLSY